MMARVAPSHQHGDVEQQPGGVDLGINMAFDSLVPQHPPPGGLEGSVQRSIQQINQIHSKDISPLGSGHNWWGFPFFYDDALGKEYMTSRDTISFRVGTLIFITYDVVFNITHMNFRYLDADGECFVAAFVFWVASMVAFLATVWARIFIFNLFA